MKRVLHSIAFLAIALVSMNAAKAQSPHFVAGSFVWETGPMSVTASGRISGLGNIDQFSLRGTVRIYQAFRVTFDCVNPSGKKGPFIDQIMEAESSVMVPIDHNGTVAFGPQTADVEPLINLSKPAWQEKFCPSKKWLIEVKSATPMTPKPQIDWNGLPVTE